MKIIKQTLKINIFFLICLSVLISQTKRDPRSVALAGTYTTIADGIFAVGYNPALLAYQQEKPFMLQLAGFDFGVVGNYLSLSNLYNLSGDTLSNIEKDNLFDNFNIFYLLVLFGALIITGTTVIVNKYNNVTGPIGYFIYGGIFTHLLSFIFFIFDPLLFDFKTLCLIIISSIFINAALLCTGISFQRSQKYYASIFCLVYIQILWSVLVGYYIFNEYLNFYAIIGAFFIVISGLFSIPSQKKQINAK